MLIINHHALMRSERVLKMPSQGQCLRKSQTRQAISALTNLKTIAFRDLTAHPGEKFTKQKLLSTLIYPHLDYCKIKIGLMVLEIFEVKVLLVFHLSTLEMKNPELNSAKSQLAIFSVKNRLGPQGFNSTEKSTQEFS